MINYEYEPVGAVDTTLIGIIGGLDFIGCEVTLGLLADNYRVKVAVFAPALGSNSLIQTGLLGNRNLEVCRVDPDDPFQLRKFIRNCSIVIHCGSPFKLFDHGDGIPVYVPLITKSVVVLEIARQTSGIKKVIFLASPVMNEITTGLSGSSNVNVQEEGRAGQIRNHHAEKAWFHAGQAAQNRIRSFSDNRIEVLFVSPVGIKNNALVNSGEITSSGLKYLFENRIGHDPLFQRLICLKAFHTLLDVRHIPEVIIRLVESVGT